MVLQCAVKPVVEWRFGNPGMVRANMICHLVLNYFQTEGMRLFDQLLKCGEVSEMIFNAVVIDGVITMVISVRAPGFIALIDAVPVVVPRSQPQGGDTKLLQVRKIIDHAPQIATVIGAWILTIIGGRWR